MADDGTGPTGGTDATGGTDGTGGSGGAGVASGQDALRTTFTTTVQSAGGSKAGIEVPDEVLEALGGGRRVPVLVTVGGHTWASTTAVMGGRTLLGMSTENRRLAGIEPGQQVEVTLERETAPREVAVPDDLAAALGAEPGLRAAFDALAPGYRKNHVVQVEGAKTEATRQRRVQKVLDSLRRPPPDMPEPR